MGEGLMNLRDDSMTTARARGLRQAALAMFWVIGLAGCGEQPPGDDSGALAPDLIALNNRGVAEMGRFD